MFTGKNTFNTGGKKSISTITKRAKSALKANAGKYASSLLSPKTDAQKGCKASFSATYFKSHT